MSLLREHGVRVESSRVKLPNGSDDRIFLAACKHCSSLSSVVLRGGSLHNSTISTFAQSMKEKLTEIDLTDTCTFDDIGIMALAAYCPSLRTLRLAGTLVSDKGLTPVLSQCVLIRFLEVSPPISKHPIPFTWAAGSSAPYLRHNIPHLTCQLLSAHVRPCVRQTYPPALLTLPPPLPVPLPLLCGHGRHKMNLS